MSISSYSVTVTLSEADHQLLDAFAAEHRISDPAEALRVLLHESADLSHTLREDRVAYPGYFLDRLSAQIDEGIAVWLSADFALDNEPYPDDPETIPSAPATPDFMNDGDDFSAATVVLADADFTPDSDSTADTLQIHPPSPFMIDPVPPTEPAADTLQIIHWPSPPATDPAPPADPAADTLQIHPPTPPTDPSTTP